MIKNIIIGVLVAMILIGGGWFVWQKQGIKLTIPQYNKPKSQAVEYQAVFLSNNQVYFGKLKSKTTQFVTLENVHYLRQQREVDAAQKLDLVKRGNELHGPTNEMQINRDHILFIEDVRSDSQVAQSIKKLKEVVGTTAKAAGNTLGVTTATPAPVSPRPTATPKNEKQIKIKDSEVGFLRVRSEPKTDSSEVGKVNPGASFKVLEEKDGWFRIDYEPGKTGWVFGEYVAVSN